jgi:hypothetical protein
VKTQRRKSDQWVIAQHMISRSVAAAIATNRVTQNESVTRTNLNTTFKALFVFIQPLVLDRAHTQLSM